MGYMGWDNTRSLPACIYHDLRTRFPTANSTGFKTTQQREWMKITCGRWTLCLLLKSLCILYILTTDCFSLQILGIFIETSSSIEHNLLRWKKRKLKINRVKLVALRATPSWMPLQQSATFPAFPWLLCLSFCWTSCILLTLLPI